MVGSGRGTLFKRKDGKYLLYLPKDLVEDTGFPIPVQSSLPVKIRFTQKGKIIVEKWAHERARRKQR